MGEVLVRGPTMMAGYWRDLEASAGRLRRLAAYGRRRRVRCRRLPDAEGPVEGSDHQRRLEHLPARSGGSAPVAPGRRRGGGDRPRGSGVGRGSRRLRRRASATDSAASAALERSLDALPRAHRAFQAAEGYMFLADLPKNNAGKVLKRRCARGSRRGANGERSRPCRHQRQRKHERRSGAGFARQADPAAMELDKLARDREAEPGPFDFLRRRADLAESSNTVA